ncbi:chitobiase/beta-hexosaminidase C-terminal domain-containing protein [Streptomyces sp. QL37]|uniref:chitobiase/beta-hexosaminidase C-terminal domain-containing protein n=1 Tax=Streptomyces sp. QL37 TaxID=2093747 RepID=UPI000CF21F68|nr:chitobiase/beta-hexosaminidase C-terminal domain-containing protein [Streptomyces sp. QL37]PPQ62022.1 phosphoesterase [Streptomyces sp. QL37]
MRFARYTPLAIAAVSAALLAPALAHADTRSANRILDAPTLSVPGGRYQKALSVTLKSERGTVVRYTLDGTTPTHKSRRYVPGKPLLIRKDTNVTAAAFDGQQAGPAVSYGYLIRGAEQPVAEIVVMSDVHTGSHADGDARHQSFFDTIGSIFPKPDAILSNGDMINDNGDGRGADHKAVAEIFQANLDRKRMTDTQLLVSNGNHDAGLAAIRAAYPREWFPDNGGGYYESNINGVHLFTVNTETYNSDTAQRTWLKGRLAEITADPARCNEPVLVQGHRPAPGTVMDGQQASNPLLTQDLAAFPQAVYFSGHSHLNVNDERSIAQKDFTAVNDGSMSYVEVDHGYQTVTDTGLANRFEATTAQALFVEVYKDRTEIARVNMAADKHDIYQGGVWSANPLPPYASAGTLSGPTWTVRLKGSTSQEIKNNFRYTAAARNTVAPAFTSRTPLKAVTAAGGDTALRIQQATDDQMVHHYDVDITDRATGTKVLSTKVLSEYYFMPRPNTLDIPVPTGAADASYSARVIAVDAYGNTSPAASLSFGR